MVKLNVNKSLHRTHTVKGEVKWEQLKADEF